MFTNLQSATLNRKQLGSHRRSKSRKLNGIILRAFFLTLIIVSIALSSLAIHLSTQIGWATQQSTRTIGGGSDSRAPGSFGARSIAVAKANNNILYPPLSKNNDNNAKQDYPNGPKNDAKYAKDRVYCMVPFVWSKESFDVIMSTWGRRCNVINFLTDSVVLSEGGGNQGDMITDDPTQGYTHYSEFPQGTFPDNVMFINMTRQWTGCKDPKSGKPKLCRHIWEKMRSAWIYVGEHHLNEAEWFCKIDYDTFFFPENLQYFVRDYKGWDPYKEHHYFGNVLGHHVSKGRPEMAAGAAACWSHKTMAGITDVYMNMPKGHEGRDRGRCEDRPLASEEIATSTCLKTELNVTVEPMRDDESREYVTIDQYSTQLTWNRTEQGEWWYWEGKPTNAGYCCAVHPMAFHKYKQKEQMKALEEQFYGQSNNKELKKLNERTRRYADKVRTAMGFD
ncbi:hypothetical protein ACHAXR_006081 [Thalassiosira sp. AJA248-18]